MVPSYLPVRRQQWRKPPPGTAWARVAAAEFLDQLGVLADDAVTALDPGLAEGTPCGACSWAQKDAWASKSLYMTASSVVPHPRYRPRHANMGW
jgi:hypothetical protein